MPDAGYRHAVSLHLLGGEEYVITLMIINAEEFIPFFYIRLHHIH